MAISENRKKRLDALRRRKFLEDTQPASAALRRRIRELREAKGLKQRELAEKMTEAGVPLTVPKLSNIERGVRRVRYDELLAFAYVLDVPLSRLMSPLDGEPPIRAGGISLERHEVANWLVWGPWWTTEARGAQTYMRLAGEIWTMAQVLDDEKDATQRAEHGRALARLVEKLRKASQVKPGVLKRQALRDEMANGSEDG